MDAMKEALRRKMMEMKGEKESSMMTAGVEKEKEGSDLAPELEGEGEVEGEMIADGEQPGIDPELLAEIVAALQASQPGAGREPQGLNERVAAGAGKVAEGMKLRK